MKEKWFDNSPKPTKLKCACESCNNDSWWTGMDGTGGQCSLCGTELDERAKSRYIKLHKKEKINEI